MSCFDRVKVGFMIGFAVGMSAAGLFGTYAALRYARKYNDNYTNTCVKFVFKLYGEFIFCYREI